MAWSWDQFMKGAAGGAAGGGGLLGPVGAIASGALGGMFSGLFGGDEYEEREKRKAALSRKLAEIRAATHARTLERLRTGGQMITTQGGAASQAARAAAARRALASGRYGDAEAFIAPETSRIATATSNAMQNFAYGTQADEEGAQRQLDLQELGIERDYADRPIAPGLGDWIGGLGDLAGQYTGLFSDSGLYPPAMPELLKPPARPKLQNTPTIPSVQFRPW